MVKKHLNDIDSVKIQDGEAHSFSVKHSTLRTRQYVKDYAVYIKITMDQWEGATMVHEYRISEIDTNNKTTMTLNIRREIIDGLKFSKMA